MLDGVWEDGFYTVFPINEYKDDLPQDFPTWEAAKEYADEEFGHKKGKKEAAASRLFNRLSDNSMP